jgi:hypothetical protein
MLDWETVDENAIYPFARYKAMSGNNNECRISYDPDGTDSPPGRPWLAHILELRADGMHFHHFSEAYASLDEAKRGADMWIGPGPS